jgi:hypothetical protein
MSQVSLRGRVGSLASSSHVDTSRASDVKLLGLQTRWWGSARMAVRGGAACPARRRASRRRPRCPRPRSHRPSQASKTSPASGAASNRGASGRLSTGFRPTESTIAVGRDNPSPAMGRATENTRRAARFDLRFRDRACIPCGGDPPSYYGPRDSGDSVRCRRHCRAGNSFCRRTAQWVRPEPSLSGPLR